MDNLKDTIIKFVSSDTSLIIEDIEKNKINRQLITDFCKGKVSTKIKNVLTIVLIFK